jgi:hypothetical protein
MNPTVRIPPSYFFPTASFGSSLQASPCAAFSFKNLLEIQERRIVIMKKIAITVMSLAALVGLTLAASVAQSKDGCCNGQQCCNGQHCCRNQQK